MNDKKSCYQIEDERRIADFKANPEGYKRVELSEAQWRVLDLYLNYGLKPRAISSKLKLQYGFVT
mgnify:CR=1 FL=1